MLCYEKQQIYRQCVEQNTKKARECRAELESLIACIQYQQKYLYTV